VLCVASRISLTLLADRCAGSITSTGACRTERRCGSGTPGDLTGLYAALIDHRDPGAPSKIAAPRRGWAAENPGRRRGIFVENAHFVHEETGFPGGAARGFSSICNLETFSHFGLVKIGFGALNGGRGNSECGVRNAESSTRKPEFPFFGGHALLNRSERRVR
jgi:hypothetical protein